MVGESEGRMTDQIRITRSRAGVMAGLNTSQKPRQLNSERNQTMETDNGKTQFLCCNRSFASQQAMRIHQAKVCRKKSQQRRSPDRETSGSIHQDQNHSMDHTTAVKGKKMEVPDKKPKITAKG